jgi:hypothetical protein
MMHLQENLRLANPGKVAGLLEDSGHEVSKTNLKLALINAHERIAQLEDTLKSVTDRIQQLEKQAGVNQR